MIRRALAGAVLAIALAGCAGVQSDLPTPGTPLTYGWVMAHHYQDWGVQIGPKVDGSGEHVAVYAWIGCAPAYSPCMYQFFHEYDALAPGSTHRYELRWNGTGWEARFDGQLRATMMLGSPSSAIYEVNYGERTTS